MAAAGLNGMADTSAALVVTPVRADVGLLAMPVLKTGVVKRPRLGPLLSRDGKTGSRYNRSCAHLSPPPQYLEGFYWLKDPKPLGFPQICAKFICAQECSSFSLSHYF